MPGYPQQKPALPADMSNDGEAPSFNDALEAAPEEVAPEEGDELDAEQAGLAEEMGLSPEQGKSLRRFIETMM